MSERIVVGLSGGVDSALAAALLQERGFAVTGCFLKVAITGAPCPWEADLPMAHRVAAHLNIPLIVKDVSVEYEREVLKPMIAAYQRGETPNPDTTCNRYIKFNALTEVAHAIDAGRIATGHYARAVRRGGATSPPAGDHVRSPLHEQVELWRGADHTKDQSYFLWQLTQEQLSMCEFPIGEWQKEDVRAEARRRGFPNWDRDSTSGVCFLGQVNLAEFLAARENVGAGFYPRPRTASATVVTTSGEIIGTIPNAEALTIGQRAPIAGQPVPRYVVANCPKSNLGQKEHRIVVSTTPEDPARYTKTITTGAPNWIGGAPQFSPPLPEGERVPAEALAKVGEGVQPVLQCTARIRHRQEPVPCTVSLITHHSLLVTIDIPLTGVAPGQAVVLTDGDRVLGGAQIVEAHR